MVYSPFKMKGHTLPGIKQSPAKHSAYGDPHPKNANSGVEEASHPSSAAAHNVKKEKSPAKLPIAAIPAIISAAGAIGGMMKKKEEE